MDKARRTPIQERAQVTVEALLEATAQLLVEVGYARLSTNRVARRAGVSVGSLYQYFSDKDALVETLVRRVVERRVADLAARIQRGDDVPLPELVRALVTGFVEAKRMEPELARVMAQELPRAGRLDLERATLGRLCEVTSAALRRRSDIRPVNAELAAFALVRAIFSVVQAAVEDRPELLADDALADTLTEISVRYLAP